MSAIEQAYDLHASAIYGFALNLTRNPDDTRDIVQDCFRKLAADPQMLDRARDQRAFLLRLAHNAFIDLTRRRDARARRHEAHRAELAGLFAPAANPDEAAFRAATEQVLAELPPDQRAVVHLKLWEQLTFEQIAETLGIPLNTAASRYRYGIDKMRDRLRPLYNEIQ